MKVFSSPTQKTGEIGENVACAYLERRGFVIVERNFTRKWGEIDIVALKGGVTHFIEVKSISRETEGYRPEEQVHALKRARLMRIIDTYISLRKVGEWVFDLMCVRLDDIRRVAKVEMFEDLIL